MRTTRKQTRGRRAGFTLIEILVAVVLLSGSLVAIMKLWSVSRSITERSRNTAEYYAIARQEVERDRTDPWAGLLNSSVSNPRRSDYDADGNLLATNLSASAAVTPNAYYRATSTYSAAQTGSETETRKKLGVQKIEVRPITNGAVETTVVYQSTMFFTESGT